MRAVLHAGKATRRDLVGAGEPDQRRDVQGWHRRPPRALRRAARALDVCGYRRGVPRAAAQQWPAASPEKRPSLKPIEPRRIPGGPDPPRPLTRARRPRRRRRRRPRVSGRARRLPGGGYRGRRPERPGSLRSQRFRPDRGGPIPQPARDTTPRRHRRVHLLALHRHAGVRRRQERVILLRRGEDGAHGAAPRREHRRDQRRERLPSVLRRRLYRSHRRPSPRLPRARAAVPRPRRRSRLRHVRPSADRGEQGPAIRRVQVQDVRL